MLKICFYVPSANKEEVKKAMFAQGAGKIGNYDSCSWEIEGMGQFRPLQGSDPYIGNKDMIETIKETRVEMVCHEDVLLKVKEALLKSHPYETPAYDITKLFEI